MNISKKLKLYIYIYIVNNILTVMDEKATFIINTNLKDKFDNVKISSTKITIISNFKMCKNNFSLIYDNKKTNIHH